MNSLEQCKCIQVVLTLEGIIIDDIIFKCCWGQCPVQDKESSEKIVFSRKYKGIRIPCKEHLQDYLNSYEGKGWQIVV